MDREIARAFADEIEKIGISTYGLGRSLGLSKSQIFGLAKSKNQIEDAILRLARGRRPKHILERIPPSMVRTRSAVKGAVRRLKKGGPTSWAMGKVMERPRKRAIAGGLIGGLLGLPAPPGIPAMMMLAPGGAAVAELPRILSLRKQRQKMIFPKIIEAIKALPQRVIQAIRKRT